MKNIMNRPLMSVIGVGAALFVVGCATKKIAKELEKRARELGWIS